MYLICKQIEKPILMLFIGLYLISKKVFHRFLLKYNVHSFLRMPPHTLKDRCRVPKGRSYYTYIHTPLHTDVGGIWTMEEHSNISPVTDVGGRIYCLGRAYIATHHHNVAGGRAGYNIYQGHLIMIDWLTACIVGQGQYNVLSANLWIGQNHLQMTFMYKNIKSGDLVRCWLSLCVST